MLMSNDDCWQAMNWLHSWSFDAYASDKKQVSNNLPIAYPLLADSSRINSSVDSVLLPCDKEWTGLKKSEHEHSTKTRQTLVDHSPTARRQLPEQTLLYCPKCQANNSSLHADRSARKSRPHSTPYDQVYSPSARRVHGELTPCKSRAIPEQSCSATLLENSKHV